MYQREISWTINRQRWIREIIAGRLRVRIVLWLISIAVTLVAFAIEVHSSPLMFFVSISVLLGFLVVELCIPPRYAITPRGIVICTQDLVQLFRLRLGVETFFVSWKRVKHIERTPNAINVFIAVGRGKPHPVLNKRVFPDKRICVYLPKGKAGRIYSIAIERTQESRSVLALRYRIRQVIEYGDPLNPWLFDPWLRINHYGDYREFRKLGWDFDYVDSVSNERMQKLSKEIQALIHPVIAGEPRW